MRKSIAEVAKLYGAEYKRFFECIDFLTAPDSSTITKEILGSDWNPKTMDNTCNYGMPLTMYYQIYKMPDTDQDVVIFAIHKGGDPRGNYSSEFVFFGGWGVMWELIDRLGGADIKKQFGEFELRYNLTEEMAYKDGKEIGEDEFYELTGESFEGFF